jgi:hypothetical protein
MSRPETGGVNWRRLRSRSGKGSSAAGLRMREWHATTRTSQNIISCSCFSWLVAQECFNAAGIWGSGPAALHPGFVSWGLVGSGCRRSAVLRRLGAARCGWPNLGSLALGLALDLLISLTGGSQIGTIPLAANLSFCRLIGTSRSSADGPCRPEVPAGCGLEDRAASGMGNARPAPEADTDRRCGGALQRPIPRLA